MAGVDLTWEMLARLDDVGARVYLLGGTEEEVQGTREQIQARFQRLRVVGARNGYFDVSGKENEAVLRAINEAQPQVLLVAMGFPRQEEWIAENMPRLNVNVAIGGGEFLLYLWRHPAGAPLAAAAWAGVAVPADSAAPTPAPAAGDPPVRLACGQGAAAEGLAVSSLIEPPPALGPLDHFGLHL